ncbi:Glu-tRNA(Gln) amidotransferase subunit GatD [Candidatus Woesearchaeota archaeon]|nr:Glu-tRNA(Gln) amidotransferase subunit GatD [Candidatus Woesearchaeota archaeon]
MKTGEYVKLETKDGRHLQGLVMKSTDVNIISLKLDSGYNIGIDRKKVKSSKVLKQNNIACVKKLQKVDFDKKLKTVTILHTGGTVASRVSYKTGAVAPSFKPEELVEMFPELSNVVNVKSKLIGNMFSEDLRFSHWNKMAKEIEKELKEVDGIILTQGTDNLGLTACALSFVLENLNKPVLLVGSQRSSDRPSSDAAINLTCAANFIAKTDFNEVGICMHARSDDEGCYILPGCKTKKLHTSRRDAFKAVNSKPIAFVTKEGNVSFLEKYHKKDHHDRLRLRLFKENLKIGILKAHPNMFAFEIKNCSKYDGLVLEGTGLAGNFPINKVDVKTQEHKLISNELKKLAKKIPVVVTSNCIFGRINMNVYDTGRNMQDIGIIGNYSDMITETAFIKLAWLLSNYDKKKVKDLFMEDFRGEISKRTEFEEEFV